MAGLIDVPPGKILLEEVNDGVNCGIAPSTWFKYRLDLRKSLTNSLVCTCTGAVRYFKNYLSSVLFGCNIFEYI